MKLPSVKQKFTTIPSLKPYLERIKLSSNMAKSSFPINAENTGTSRIKTRLKVLALASIMFAVLTAEEYLSAAK